MELDAGVLFEAHAEFSLNTMLTPSSHCISLSRSSILFVIRDRTSRVYNKTQPTE